MLPDLASLAMVRALALVATVVMGVGGKLDRGFLAAQGGVAESGVAMICGSDAVKHVTVFDSRVHEQMDLASEPSACFFGREPLDLSWAEATVSFRARRQVEVPEIELVWNLNPVRDGLPEILGCYGPRLTEKMDSTRRRLPGVHPIYPDVSDLTWVTRITSVFPAKRDIADREIGSDLRLADTSGFHQRLSNVDDADRSDRDRGERCPEHSFCPESHVLLGFQIAYVVFIAPLVVCGVLLGFKVAEGGLDPLKYGSKLLGGAYFLLGICGTVASAGLLPGIGFWLAFEGGGARFLGVG